MLVRKSFVVLIVIIRTLLNSEHQVLAVFAPELNEFIPDARQCSQDVLNISVSFWLVVLLMFITSGEYRSWDLSSFD